MSLVHLVLGTLLSPTPVPVRRRRDERGLSQSTEQALLLGGAVAVGIVIVAAVTLFVKGKLAEAGMKA